MSAITTLLYWISTGMLVPVIIVLLAAFVWALLMLGDLFGLYTARLRRSVEINTLLTQVKHETPTAIDFRQALKLHSRMREHLIALQEVGWHTVHGEKILADFDLACEKELEGPSTLMRVGPMLGLMGTLIPMGPALVGLAAGDLASMAANMQVAFATTVVGIFVGAIGYINQLIKRRWFAGDGAVLQYLFELSKLNVPNTASHEELTSITTTENGNGKGNEKNKQIYSHIQHR